MTVFKDQKKVAADIVSTPFANSVVNDLLHLLFKVQKPFVAFFSLLPSRPFSAQLGWSCHRQMGFAEDMANFPLTSFNYESRGGNSDFRVLTSDFRLPTSDFRLPTSDFRLPTSALFLFLFYFFFFISFNYYYFFFVINSSEQHTATVLVNFFIISYRFRLITQTSSGSYNKIVREHILYLIIVVQWW